MTKSWWSGEPGEQVIDALNPKDDNNATDNSRLPVTWWTIAIVVIVLLAFVGAGIYLLADTAKTCKDAADAAGCSPNR